MKPRTLIALIAIAVITMNVSTRLIAQTPANPVPFINQPLVPDATTPGRSGLTLTVNGAGFVSTSVVKWNGGARTTTFVSNSQLQANILASDIAKAGTASVTVVNPNPSPGGGTSNVAFFEVTPSGCPVGLTRADYRRAGASHSVVVGDFNRDGKLDLAVANYGSVGVFLGNGDGTFQPPVFYSAGNDILSLVVADFDRNGLLDLATAASGTGEVVVLLGQGDGTFQPGVSYESGFSPGTNPASVAVGDFNGDGKLDLAVANSADDSVGVLLGNGDGTLEPPKIIYVGTEPVAVAIGDFNGDGKLDLAVANAGSNSVSVLLGNGDGTFQAQLEYGTGSNPTSVAVGDFNRIGRLDLAVAALNVASVLLQKPPTGPGPNAILLPTSLTFGTQLVGTASSAQSLTLTNCATATLSIRGVGLTGADPGDFAQTKTCGSSVAPGASCTINVTFKPAQSGARTANLSVTDNAPGNPQTVRVTGVGTVVQLNPASLSFGTIPVGTLRRASTTLTNVGSTPLSVKIAIAGADTDEFSQANTCGSSVGPGKSCAITVTFRPKEGGSDSAEVSISDNGGGSPQQVSLSGSGCVYYRNKCLPFIGSPAVQSALAKSQSTAVPSVTGVNRVGTRIIDLVDSSRIDPFATNGLNRELLVRFWYPASAEQGCKLADYTSPRVWNSFAELTGLPLPAVTTNSCLDAPIADGEHPAVVFTHGYTGTFTDYTFLFEDLASRGYIVVSIDHTYEATAIEFPDERFVKSLVGSHLTNMWQTDDQTLSSALSVRLDDLKFVVDELERLNASTGNAFAGKLDLTRLALAGHSLGGLTAWFGVQRDSRFKAAVLLDPCLPDIPVGSTETPVMLLTMGSDQRNEDECQLWSDLLGPRLAVNLRGAEHVAPSDLVWLAKGAVKTGLMGPEKTITAVRDYIAAFLNTNVRGRPLDRLLTGPSSSFPDAEVTTQRQSLCGEAAAH